MIYVEPRPEPDTFNEQVRAPGRRFLEATPNPTTQEFSQHSYWRRNAGELYASYGGICAYSCHWIAPDTGWKTVEHFVPKSIDPLLAYEWANYRLVCGRLNGRKGNHQDVLDPFDINDDIFVIDFPSMLVKPKDGISKAQKEAVLATIARLKLNDDETCVVSRLRYIKDYCFGYISGEFLQRNAPFIFRKLLRQEIIEYIDEIMNIRE